MKRKPIKIDWDALDEAFNDQNEELDYYLDLVTGHVVLHGEEDDLDDEDDYSSATGAGSPPPRDDATRLYIHPPDTATKIEWLRAFLDDQPGLSPEVVALLREALQAEQPAERISAVLNANAGERESWYRYRSDRIHGRIDRWLADNRVELVEPAPWKP